MRAGTGPTGSRPRSRAAPDLDGGAVRLDTPPLVGRHARAVYRAETIPQFAHNPLIRTLPRPRNDEAVIGALYHRPTLPHDLGALPVRERIIAALAGLNEFRFPIPPVLEVERRICNVIHAGYVGRDPLALNDRQRVMAAADYDPDDQKAVYAPNQRPGPGGILIQGEGGMGKSTAVEDVLLKSYPQVFYHTKYEGRPLILKQCVWLRVLCPHNRLPAQLCRDILEQLDHALAPRKSFVETYVKGRAAEGDLMRAAETVTGVVKLGALVVDEIQNVVTTRGHGDVRIVNFLVNLANKLGVPIVFVGTPEIADFLRKLWRLARRTTALGEVTFTRLARDGVAWRQFCAAMWDIQYVTRPAPLGADAMVELHKASEGIVALAVASFFLAQERAMLRGEEVVTAATITPVARRMRLVRPILDALGGPSDLRMSLRDIIDLVPPGDPGSDSARRTGRDRPPAVVHPASDDAVGATSADVRQDPSQDPGHRSSARSGSGVPGAAPRSRRTSPDRREAGRTSQKARAAATRAAVESRHVTLEADGLTGAPGLESGPTSHRP